MSKIECYLYCDYNPETAGNSRKIRLFGLSDPKDDYFNDNLDQFYDEDDFYDYTESLASHTELEDKSFTHSHRTHY